MFTRAKVTASQTVLVAGVSGGIGSAAAIQLANAHRAKVIVITSPAKTDAVLNLGAEQILMRSKCEFHSAKQ